MLDDLLIMIGRKEENTPVVHPLQDAVVCHRTHEAERHSVEQEVSRGSNALFFEVFL